MPKTKLLMKSSLVFILIMGVFSPLFQSPVNAQTTAAKSTWLWHTDEIIQNSAEIIDFATQNGVKTIYLQINKDIADQYYINFIKSATEKGVQVYALDGAPDWVSPKGGVYQDQFFNWLTNYQSKVQPNERFTGVHLDIEPYIYSGWKTNYKKTVHAYQTLISKASLSSKSLGLTFAADIPFWFDEQTYRNTFGKGNLASWVISKTDSTTIMAYRDQAVGPNGIIELVRYEMNEAKRQGKKIEIAVETLQSSEGNFLSFYEEGRAHMNSQLSLVETEYEGYTSFHGFGIHYLQSWMNLKP
ncbi:hypothetical protein [Litchfieldia salsa]|uniref:Amidase n=1 Tax=Litchfieldia salsa TaxID=930152 RepID=A0A1H0U7F4_9BACI|nr:hypothetical protein [Litchfieldia salsa]SDP62232.1 hypothetical protein SAMN05216565_104210 [Litchfieldia salsa]